jgi:hypothetical protein
VLPTYAIVGAARASETSAVFHNSWTRLSRYAAEQDGILAAWQGVPPGATFLGIARADHWGIALPFDEASTHSKAVNHSRFPRDALFEALVRFVSADMALATRSTAREVPRSVPHPRRLFHEPFAMATTGGHMTGAF